MKAFGNCFGEGGFAQNGAGLNYSQRYNYAYGVVIDESQANPDLTRIGNMEMAKRAAVNEMAVQGTLNIATGDLKKFNRTNGLLYEDGSISITDGSAGNVMSYMPPFYFNVEPVSATAYRLWVSDRRIQGFRQHPGWCLGSFKASVNNTAIFGKPVNSLWSVKNESIVFRGGNNSATNDALQKGFLGKPRTSLSRTQFRQYAQNQSTDGGIIGYNAHVGLLMLFATKYATLNSQKPVSAKVNGYFAGGLGNGLSTVASADWNTYNAYNPLAKTGLTLGLGLTDGEINLILSAFNAGDVSVKQNTMMAIEGVFGDLWEWTQDINILKQTVGEGDKFLAYIYDNNQYEDIIGIKHSRSFEFAKTQGWLSKIKGGEYFDTLAKETGGLASSSTCFTDYFYNSATTGLRGFLRSGSSYSSSYCGLAFSSSDFGFGDTHTFLGSRFGFYGRVRPVV